MNSQKIAVIDYGMGNLHSVASALAKIAPNCEVAVTSDADAISASDRVIFPGVGAIRDCMAEILRLNINHILATQISSGKPVLAICVGMQALMTHSEENEGVDCLGHFDGKVQLFSDHPKFAAENRRLIAQDKKMKVPHMGWNQVQQQAHPLWQNIENNSRFYFVHSYFVGLNDSEFEAGRCHYGLDFTAAIARDNLFAVQFHPEKSHTNGLQLLKNFVQWQL